ncbi:MAG TPA: glycosyltransferase family 2 protein [Blastocatellia bacterium]|nr:glycosyltransferase family 2 protein [Blastocatellia bacterium]
MSNEEATVTELLKRVLMQLSDNDRVFCVVDNSSLDTTRRQVEEYALIDLRVLLVWAPENRCVVDAYFAGYRAAIGAGAQWILEMDGGFSHLPEEIPRFVTAINQGYDYVAGSRFMKGGSYKGAVSRKMISWGGARLSNFLLGTRMRDMTSGFECFSRSAMLLVLNHGVSSRAHFFQTEIKYLLRDSKWVEVPISYSNPSKSVGAGSLLEAFKNLYAMYQKSRRQAGETN